MEQPVYLPPLSDALGIALTRLPAPVPIAHGRVDRAGWQSAADAVREAGGRLVALWGVDRYDEFAVCVAYVLPGGLAWLELPLEPRAAGSSGPGGADGTGDTGSEDGPGANGAAVAAAGYPGLAGRFACAARMQRAIADLLGLRADGALDTRPWLDHGGWAGGGHPLRHAARGDDAAGQASSPHDAAPAGEVLDYPFVRVEGDGVHEIPVGPVHAGIIEPGHFRFSVVGEKVLRLEERLGYKHKGIERRFVGMDPLEAHRLAGRVSGDSTVAYAWACCMAVEAALGIAPPPRAAVLRALMLERERVANHLGDLGALGNDAAFAFGLAQFSRLREDWLRLSQQAFGHRLMMDRIVPGGVAVVPGRAQVDAMRRQCEAIEREVRQLRRIYDEHAGLVDRFMGTGRVSPALAAQLGLTGLAGRASGQPQDLRCDHPFAPYDALAVRRATSEGGDVAARVAVRFDELFESLRLIEALCARLREDGDAPARIEPVRPRADAAGTCGAGWVEGWRGEVFVALEIADRGAGARIARCHCHDPSWQNWPVLEHAIIGNIVPDFPLINKSFNLSYAGHDL